MNTYRNLRAHNLQNAVDKPGCVKCSGIVIGIIEMVLCGVDIIWFTRTFFHGNHRATFQKLITFEKWVSVLLLRCQYVIAVKQICSHSGCSVSCHSFFLFYCSVHQHDIIWHMDQKRRSVSGVSRSIYNIPMLTQGRKKDISNSSNSILLLNLYVFSYIHFEIYSKEKNLNQRFERKVRILRRT